MITQRRHIRFLEAHEVRSIIAAIPDDARGRRDRALIEVLFSTGLRISEALALPAQVLKDGSGTQEATVIGKGGWQRVVYFSPVAVKATRAYLAARSENDHRLFPITVRMAQIMVKARAKSVGIEGVHPHTFRHSLATDLLRRGVDIAFVSKFLGHRNIQNTLIYSHIVAPQLQAIHKKLYK